MLSRGGVGKKRGPTVRADVQEPEQRHTVPGVLGN